MCGEMKGKRSCGGGGDSFGVVWFMCVLCALRPCKFISTVPVQQHDLLLFSMSPHNNRVSQTWCLTLIYDPSQKLHFRCPLWQRNALLRRPLELNVGFFFCSSGTDLPARTFVQFPNLFEYDIFSTELNWKHIWTEALSPIWFSLILVLCHGFLPSPDLSAMGFCLTGGSQETIVCLTSSAHAFWWQFMPFYCIYYFPYTKLDELMHTWWIRAGSVN